MGSGDIDEVLVCLAELFNLVFTVVTSAPSCLLINDLINMATS